MVSILCTGCLFDVVYYLIYSYLCCFVAVDFIFDIRDVECFLL